MDILTNYAIPILFGIIMGSWLRTVATSLTKIEKHLEALVHAQLGQLRELQEQRKK